MKFIHNFIAALVLMFLPLVALAAGTTGINDQTNVGRTLTVNTDGSINTTAVAGTAILGKVGIDQTTDITTNGVEIAPTAGATAGITPVVSGAAEGTHVLKGGAGNLYSVYATAGATAGFLMVFNATAAPGDGAVTPIQCIQVPANTTQGVSFNPGPPEVYATGISVAFSTTGCFTKTVSATAFFHGSVK